MRTETIDKTFKINEGATEILFSDRHAYSILSISPSGKSMKIQRDNTKLLNPDSLKFNNGGFLAHVEGNQEYEYIPNNNNIIRSARLHKNGKWYIVNGYHIIPGKYEYFDYNF